MTMDQIVEAMRLTRAELLETPAGGRGADTERMIRTRREFIHRAFAEGHEPEAIGAYIDRTQITVMHALRMCAMDNYGGDYGRTEAELKFAMRSAA